MVNAFWLDEDVDQAARWLVDRHVTSSVFENAMVLTTAVQVNGYPENADEQSSSSRSSSTQENEDLYFSHRDHPLTRWATESHANWRRLRAYAAAAHEEWRYRWDHGDDDYHASWAVVTSLDDAAVRGLDWPSDESTDPPQVTGEWTADHYVDAYRYYYANEKRHLFAWAKDRTEPPWIDEYTVESADETGASP